MVQASGLIELEKNKMIMQMLGKYIVAILGTLTVVLITMAGIMLWNNWRLEAKVQELKIGLAVAEAASKNQEVKIVESKVIEEKLKVITKDKIKVVKERVYDANKTECDNTIAIMRTVF